MITNLTFPDGGTLSVEYGGDKDGIATLTAPTNEGKDRSLVMKLQTIDGKATASVSVTQDGKREEFVAGDNFFASDGEFLVLKDGIQ